MARPYSFDPDAALDAAMHVFWRDGYDRASLSELQKAMGIQRGSLYQEFGSKKKLFLSALARYVAAHVDPGVTLLTSSTLPGRDRIRQFFEGISADEHRGCLLCNTVAGAAGTDEEIREAVSAQLERLRRAFDEALIDELGNATARQVEAARLTQEYIGKRVETRAAP